MEFQELAVGEKFIIIYDHDRLQYIKDGKELFIKTKEVDRDKKGPGEAVSLNDGEISGIAYHTPVIRIKV